VLRKVFSTWPHVLRALAMAMAALSIAWGIALPSGVVAALVGAALGPIAGHFLGRSRLRLWVVLVGIALFAFLSYELAAFALRSDLIPGHLGIGRTMRAAAVLRFGSVALAITASLRALAVRRPVTVGLELLAVAAAVPLTFAAHRDGVIARPLWLSDWAWQNGIDPTDIFLAIGGTGVGVLALLLLAEGRSRRALSAFAALLLLTVFAIFGLRLIGVPTPNPIDSLGLEGDGGATDAGLGDDNGGKADAGADGGARGRGGGGEDDGGEAATSEGLDGGGEGRTPPDGGSQDVPPDLDKASADGKSAAPMAVVLLDDDYSPPSQNYYLREEALSQFNGTRLVHTTRADVDLDAPGSFPSEETPVRDAPTLMGRSLVRTTVALLVEHPHPFALETPTLMAPAQNPNPSRFKRAYRVESLAQGADYKDFFGRAAGDASWSPEVRAHYLEGPDDPRYLALAREIVNRLPASRRSDPFSKAVAIKLRLDDTSIYSTKRRYAGAADPTADFLFGDRTGYCVHFAHAAVFLWRALGIPARVSTGYMVEEDSRHGGSAILVRSGDAHAWPELYLDGYGWVILDIAPKTNLDPPMSSVDGDLQRLLGEMARSMPPPPDENGLRKPGHILRELALGTLAGLALLLLALYTAKVWRRVVPFLAGERALPRVGYRSMLDMLSEVGVSRRFGESREAFARRVRPLAPSFVALTGLHVAAKLGPPAAAREAKPGVARTAWRDGLAAVRGEIRKRVRPARRILGILNPTSFFGSR
jgi:protein-glutamine gamma-glutamyltransferase